MQDLGQDMPISDTSPNRVPVGIHKVSQGDRISKTFCHIEKKTKQKNIKQQLRWHARFCKKRSQTKAVATVELSGKGYSFLSVAGASDNPIAALTIEQDFTNICVFGCHFQAP